MNYRLSDFCHFVEGKNNWIAVYNALTLGVVIVNQEIGQLISSARANIDERVQSIIGSEVIDQLVEHKLILPSNSKVDIEDYSNIKHMLNCKRIGILYLMLYDGCNLACRYCFVENAMPDDYRFSLMDKSTAKAGIDLFAKAFMASHGITEPQIIFYGGEPTVNLTVLEYSIDYINTLKLRGKLPGNTSITLNTNGTLINSEVVRILRKANNLNVAISLDGPAHIHDVCRPYHNQKGSFQDIMAGHKILLSSGIEAGFCCTISRYNVGRLEEIAHWFVEELGCKSMGFNIMIENTEATNLRGETEVYATQAAQGIIQCFRFFREVGVYEDRVMRKVNAFVDGDVYIYDCGGCGQQLVVSADGLVGVCQGYCGTKKNFIDLNASLDPLNNPLWDEWRNRSPLSMPQCKDCIALSVCGGGCPYSADTRHGSIWSLDDVFCVHAKATIRFLLQNLIEECIKN
ncbi:MAG: hypothetical protein COU22_03120 [Candidatus Komeilibacteria bacterium CG10_big_fil_rev_8_21_14_0_10_41_13]|uniref:Radical SAM core domain-containing protein n=1 Tax=Candidatus Komeilibacteria bacterium CG10_big_fil_rev_8_21_14_0_10_41_13 TaxID=1974476 RepID=A0A2M6WBZ0_9BACT|nr:MAG: hypothetical protein COU22_03120 [Candidatus Komeilibacteria bacterium CG10_big_fil_rev_8_21_14_0_10_41_13]